MIAGGSGFFLSGRALAPIDRITRTARRIAEGTENLSTRLDLPRNDDEVGRLAETFDAMLDRLDNAFRREHQFTSDASHELRTPLAAIQSILGQVRAKRRTPEEYEKALADVAEETSRLRALSENLLRLARGDDRIVSRNPVELSTLLHDVAEVLRPLAEKKSLTLSCDVPDSLTVIGDRDDLVRLFLNLLDNAIKFTDRGSITISGFKNQRGAASVVCTDTGIGISVEHLARIFDRFYRVDQSRTNEGAGLGLALAMQIARAHGAEIGVNSTPGEGTSFTVTF
jgi:signal transduction histidine kinase